MDAEMGSSTSLDCDGSKPPQLEQNAASDWLECPQAGQYMGARPVTDSLTWNQQADYIHSICLPLLPVKVPETRQRAGLSDSVSGRDEAWSAAHSLNFSS